MKFGYFDDANKEYVITSPKTPLPWINYLGSENFFSLISNTCGGYSFYKDAKLLRLTRYRYNNVPFDSNGHYYYIKEGDTIWNPGWMPAKVNCETANINKTVNAAVKQMEDIKRIRDTIGFDNIPEPLAEIAQARLDYPEATLKELGTYLDPPVGKSGVNHRLRKLAAIAENLI